MSTYSISKGWKIFAWIFSPLIIALFMWMLLRPFYSPEKDARIYWITVPVSLAMIVLVTIGLIDLIKSKFVIGQDSLILTGAFQTRELLFSEIKGYRINEKYIFIEPEDRDQKKIKINTYFERTEEIKEWLAERYKDLDVEQGNQETEQILSNNEFGLTIEEREHRLTKAKKVSRILNVGGAVIGAWTLFFPTPYEYAILGSAIVPIICLIIIKIFRGLIRIDERKGSAYPSVFLAIFVPAMATVLRAILDYEIFNYSNAWIPSLLIAIIYMVILAVKNSEFNIREKKSYWLLAAVFVFIFGYGYGTVVNLNCIYDHSNAEIYKAKILNKTISSGKTTTYYLQLTPWGPQKEIEKVSVSKRPLQQVKKR
ncbi:MAG: hypothetical protein QM802_23240 [Agriterribacter sp.]